MTGARRREPHPATADLGELGHRARTWPVALLALLPLLVPCWVSGQLSAGLQGSWGSRAELGLGGRVVLGLDRVVAGLETAGTFDYFFPGEGAAANVASWEGTAGLLYRVPAASSGIVPYGGLGFDAAHYRASVEALGTDLTGSETRYGTNLMVGILFGTGRTTPFLEARFTLGGSEQFLMSAGVRF